MCLFIKSKEYNVAKEDITAYAVRVYLGRVICSPINKFCEWEVGETKAEESDCEVHDMVELNCEKDIAVCLDNDYQYMICGGMFHLYKNLDDAKKMYEYLKPTVATGIYPESGTLLTEHIIPVGSKYYEGSTGTFITSDDEIVSLPTPGYAANITTFTQILESCTKLSDDITLGDVTNE